MFDFAPDHDVKPDIEVVPIDLWFITGNTLKPRFLNFAGCSNMSENVLVVKW